MLLSGDYHTHTTYSHGKGSVLENATVAKEKGLVEIGITDHGFSHPAFGLRKRKLDNLRKDIERAKEQTKVNVLMGVESNIISTDGTVDLKEKYYDKFDLFLAGIHKFVLYKFPSLFSLFVPNFFDATFNVKPPKWVIKENTKAYINTVKNNPVDMLTHVNFCCFADAKEVAKCCADYGTYFEISSRKTHLTDKEWEDVLTTDVRFLISSDAHKPSNISNVSFAEELIKRLNFPLDRIDNLDGRTPNFRFSEFKKR